MAVAYTPDGIPINDDELHSAIASGSARFKTGDQVHFVGKTGEHYSVPGEQAWKEIQHGAKPLTSAEFEHYQAVKQAGESPLEVAKTAGAGLARSLTLGVSDPVLEAVSPGYAKQEAIRQEANPWAQTAGEVTGYALPIAGELGIGGKVVKGLTAVPRGVSTIARGTGEVATKGLAQGGVKRIAKGAITGAVEGTAYGTQEAISEQTVHDEPVTAQNILFNSAVGAGVGGLLGGLEHVVAKGKSKLQALPKELETSVKKPPSLLDPPTPAAAPEPTGKLSLLDRIKGKVQQTTADASVGMELRGSGLIGSDVKKIVHEGGPEAAERIARRLKTEPGVTIGDGPQDIYRKYMATKAQAGQTFGELENALEANNFRVDAKTVLDDIDQNVLKPLRESGLKDNRRLANRIDDGILSDFRKQTSGETDDYLRAMKKERVRVAGEEADKIRQELTDFGQPTRTVREVDRLVKQGVAAKVAEIEEKARQAVLGQGIGIAKPELTFEELRALRKTIDKKLDLNKAAGDLTEKGKIIRGIRDEMEQSLGRQIATKVDPALAKAYTDAKLRYKDWKRITDLVRDRNGQNQGNRFLSLTDTVSAAEGAVAAGPIGAAAGFIMNKGLRDPRVSRVAASVANKLAGERAVLSAGGVAREAQNAVGKSAEAVAETISKNATPITRNWRAAAYQVPVLIGKSTATIAELNQKLNSFDNTVNPEHEQRLAVLDGQPGLQQEVIMSQAAAVKTVLDMMPRADQPYNPVLGEHQAPPPNSRAQQFAETVKLLGDPAALLGKLDKGTLTRQQVAVLNQVLPSPMQELKKHTLIALIDSVEKGKTPNYQTRLKLGILTGLPIDPSDTPQSTVAIQRMYSETPMAAAPPKAPRRSGGSANTKLASRRESSTDRFNT